MKEKARIFPGFMLKIPEGIFWRSKNMMGPRQRQNSKLFYTQFNLDQRIRPDHPLRKVQAVVDFDFVRRRVKSLYGRRGNPSVDPVVLLKLMFLLFYENVPSERALMERMPERLDWLWFCGYDLDDSIPDHSVISKARKRWGIEIFYTIIQFRGHHTMALT
jgi:transposase